MKISFPKFLTRFLMSSAVDHTQQSQHDTDLPNVNEPNTERGSINAKRVSLARELEDPSDCQAGHIDGSDIPKQHLRNPVCSSHSYKTCDRNQPAVSKFQHGDKHRKSCLNIASSEVYVSVPPIVPPGEWKSSKRHLSTPMPRTPVFSKKSSLSLSHEPPTPGLFTHNMSGWACSVLATPMVLSSLDSLTSCPTPADAFPDLLQLIECDYPPSRHRAGSQISSDSCAGSSRSEVAGSARMPQNDPEFVEMLMTVAEEIESENTVPRKTFAYTRPEDDLQSRRSGQRKGRHAKRMTEEDEEYLKKRRLEDRRKNKQVPRQGVRKSARIKNVVKYTEQ